MPDSHRLAPNPELTFEFFGGGRGAGVGGEMRQRRKHTEQNGKGLALAQKQHSRPRERVGAGSSRSPSDPPCPLGRAQTSKWSLPNLFRGQERGRGHPWLKRKNRAWERSSPRRPLGERGQSIMIEDEMRGSGGQHNVASSFSLPGS